MIRVVGNVEVREPRMRIKGRGNGCTTSMKCLGGNADGMQAAVVDGAKFVATAHCW